MWGWGRVFFYNHQPFSLLDQKQKLFSSHNLSWKNPTLHFMLVNQVLNILGRRIFLFKEALTVLWSQNDNSCQSI